MQLNRSYFRWLMACFLCMLAAILPLHAAVTVTGDNGVWYDVIQNTHTVKISKKNATIFASTNTELTIPAAVIDVSDTKDSDEPYLVISMDDGAFKDCKSLTKVTIEAAIPMVPDDAFLNCSALTQVSLPSSITIIGNNAFSGCTQMATMPGQYSLTSVGDKAFYNCASLKAMRLEDGLTYLGISCFENCAELEAINLPSSLSMILGNTFKNCSSLTTASMGEGLAEIHNNAFDGCKVLKFPALPTTITNINYQAFANCDALGDVKLVAGCDVASYVFDNSNLSTLTFPELSLTLNQKSFASTKGLTAVTLPGYITTIPTSLFTESQDLTTLNLQAGIIKIDNTAFEKCDKLTTVNFPSTLEEIGEKSFMSCSQLKDPELPASLKKINSRAFSSCTSMNSINLPAGITIADFAFSDTNLMQLNLPDAEIAYIHPHAFYGNKTMTELTIPGGMKTVPESVFSSFTALARLTIGEGITAISKSAFSSCIALKEVNLPASLEKIDQYGFYNTAIEQITLPEGLKSIESRAFQNSKLTSIEIPGTVEYIGTPGDSNGPFAGITTLTSVVFKGCKRIGSGSFYGCRALESVTFCSLNETIEAGAFQNCAALKEINLVEGLKFVGNNAFNGCTTQKEVTLASGVTYEGSCFGNCGIKQINFPDQECYFTMTSCFNSNGNLKEVTIPAWMTEVPLNMFEACSGLNNINFHDGVKRIGNNAFRSCRILTLNLPANLEYIGEYAFAFNDYNDCYTTLTLPNKCMIDNSAFESNMLTEINFPIDAENACTFGNSVFRISKKLKKITLPEWLTEIPDYFLAANIYGGNVVLEEVEMSSATTRIGDSAFFGQSFLHDVTFPDPLVYIGKEAFKKCGMNHVGSAPGVYPPEYLFGPVVLNEGVTIGDNAFQECPISELIFKGCASFGKDWALNVKTIKKISFPECMTQIPSGFCSGWANLTEVNLDPFTTSIGNYAFSGCSSLKSIKLYDGITSIGTHAFAGSGITELVLPDNNVSLEVEALQGMTSLEKVTISAKQQSIPDYCFDGCTSLVNVIWANPADGAKRPDINLGFKAFINCKALNPITFPDANVTTAERVFEACGGAESIIWPGADKSLSLGAYCFNNCRSLKEITTHASTKNIPYGCFQSCSSLKKFIMHPALESVGNQAFQYSGLEEIEWNNKVHTLSSYAFNDCKLKSLIIPENVKVIDSYCFESNKQLTELKLPSALDEWDYYSFQNCENLRTVEIPESYKLIPANSFYGCTNLASVTLHEGLERINASAFENCSGLENITLPATLANISHFAFKKSGIKELVINCNSVNFEFNVFESCENLKKVYCPGNIFDMGSSNFAHCINLEEFDYKGDTPIRYFKDYCFYDCQSLKTVDNFFVAPSLVGYGIFKDCTSLTSITIPSKAAEFSKDMLAGCTSLRQIIWAERTDQYQNFGLTPYAIADCPLDAVSYIKFTNMKPGYITPYAEVESVNTTNPDMAKLVVPRGEKWKYVQAGYNKIFDIIEDKNPQFEFEGDLRSTYNIADNRNHYMARIRWHLPLSDLDPDGDTNVKIYRDNKLVGDVILHKQTLPYNDENQTNDGRKVIKVSVSYKKNDQYEPYSFNGDFMYTNEDGLYVLEACNQSSDIFYDAESERRLISIENSDYKSWFVMRHEFDGPVLSDDYIPEVYTYTATMNGHSYQIPVNNENFSLGLDNKRYSWKTIPATEIINSDQALELRPMRARPDLTFPGLYHESLITADKQHELEGSLPNKDVPYRQYTLQYNIDPQTINQKGNIPDWGLNNCYVINEIYLYEVDENGKPIADKKGITELSASARREPIGDLNLNKEMDKPVPGRQYMIVTNSEFRGTFGSAILTIPDVPEMQFPEITVKTHPNYGTAEEGHNHLYMPMHASLQFNIEELQRLGYNKLPEPGDFHVGLWRTTGVDNPNPAYLHAPAQETLVHHVEGRQQIPQEKQSCAPCEQTATMSVTDNTIYYDDVFYAPWESTASALYTPRVYIRVPDAMMGGTSEKWVALEAGSQYGGIGLITDVTRPQLPMPADDADTWYYDIQGQRIQHPAKGQILLKVTTAGVTKIRY